MLGWMAYGAARRSGRRSQARRRRKRAEQRRLGAQAERQRLRAPEPGTELQPASDAAVVIKGIAWTIVGAAWLAVFIWLLIATVWVGVGWLIGTCYFIGKNA